MWGEVKEEVWVGVRGVWRDVLDDCGGEVLGECGGCGKM